MRVLPALQVLQIGNPVARAPLAPASARSQGERVREHGSLILPGRRRMAA